MQKKNFAHKNINYQVCDATRLLFPDECFDVVVSFEVIEHIKAFKKYLSEIIRVLNKNGVFIFSTPNSKTYRAAISAYHYKEFSASELKALCKQFQLTLKLCGQSIINKKYLFQEQEYVTRYRRTTLGGNNYIKKILHQIPPEWKAAIYRKFWNELPTIKENEVIISTNNLESALTFIGVCKKKSQ